MMPRVRLLGLPTDTHSIATLAAKLVKELASHVPGAQS